MNYISSVAVKCFSLESVLITNISINKMDFSLFKIIRLICIVEILSKQYYRTFTEQSSCDSLKLLPSNILSDS